MPEELSKNLNSLSLKEDHEVSSDVEDADVPDDIKNLIEESIDNEHSDSPTAAASVSKIANQSKDGKTAVTTDELCDFFIAATRVLNSNKLERQITEKVQQAVDLKKAQEEKLANKADESDVKEGNYAESEKDDSKEVPLPETKLNVIRKSIEGVYERCWRDLGIDVLIGKHAITTAEDVLNNPKLSEDKRAKLKKAIDEFASSEHRVVGSHLLGKDEYNRRQAEKDNVVMAKEKLKEQLEVLDPQARGELIIGIKTKGMELRKRMMEMGQEAAIKYMDNMTIEDKDLLVQLSALTLLMQDHNHGHSHNGQPCTGHGHAQHSHEQHEHQHQHGHSHGGQPCHGHGGPSDKSD